MGSEWVNEGGGCNPLGLDWLCGMRNQMDVKWRITELIDASWHLYLICRTAAVSTEWLRLLAINIIISNNLSAIETAQVHMELRQSWVFLP